MRQEQNNDFDDVMFWGMNTNVTADMRVEVSFIWNF